MVATPKPLLLSKIKWYKDPTVIKVGADLIHSFTLKEHFDQNCDILKYLFEDQHSFTMQFIPLPTYSS